MIIYQITNTVNQKIYIGKTIKSANNRFTEHIYFSNRGGNTALAKAIRKYGQDSFLIETLEVVENDDINSREKYWIATLAPSYNMTTGGDGGDTSKHRKYKPHSKETLEKIAEASTGRYHTEETKRKLSVVRRGIKKTEEHKQKISQALIGKSCPHISESNKRRSRPTIAFGILYKGITEAMMACQRDGICQRVFREKLKDPTDIDIVIQ